MGIAPLPSQGPLAHVRPMALPSWILTAHAIGESAVFQGPRAAVELQQHQARRAVRRSSIVEEPLSDPLELPDAFHQRQSRTLIARLTRRTVMCYGEPVMMKLNELRPVVGHQAFRV